MKVKAFFLAIALWSVDLFFCMCNLLLSASETSTALMIFSAGMAVIIGFCFLGRIFLKKMTLTNSELRVMCFPTAILILLLLTMLFRGNSNLAFSTLKCLVCYAVPMTMLAIVCYDNEAVLYAGRFADFLLLLFDIYFIFILGRGILTQTDVRSLQGDMNIGYQSTSYYGAYAFSIGLYAILFQRQEKRTAKRIVFGIFRIATVFLSLIVAIYGSGRGAMVVIVCVFFLLIAMNLKGSKNFGKFMLIAAISVIALVVLFRIVSRNSALSRSFDRIYALFGTGNVAYETTSGRTVKYNKCLQAFLDSPLIGNGIGYAYYSEIGQPHQMFLEILVEGGLVYFGIWVYILVSTVRNLRRIMKMDLAHRSGYIFLTVAFVTQIIGLQFSGFYNQNAMIWFFIAYINLRYRYLRSRPQLWAGAEPYPVSDDSNAEPPPTKRAFSAYPKL